MTEELAALLERQDGVLARRQAQGVGVSPAAWAWKLRRGHWQRLLPGVAVTHTGLPTAREKAWAACLYGGPGAALSGDAALLQHGFDVGGPTTLDLVIPPNRRVLSARFEDGGEVAVRRLTNLESWRTTRRELPLLHVHAAVVHAASWAATDRAAEWRLAAVVQRRLSVPRLIRETVQQMPSLRRRALILDVLVDVEQGAHAASELQFLRFCRQYGLPLPDDLQLRVRVGGLRVLDARYRRQRVTIEIDGAHHRLAAQWHDDALRTLQVAAHLPGERVLRVTSSMLRHDAEQVAHLLREILCRTGGSGGLLSS